MRDTNGMPVRLNVRDFGRWAMALLWTPLRCRARLMRARRRRGHGGGAQGRLPDGHVGAEDNVTLYVAADATVLGSTDLADYVVQGEGDAPHRHCLLTAHGARNIALAGEGVIDGQGAAFDCVSRQGSIPRFRGEAPREQDPPDAQRKTWPPRPMLIIFAQCENVSVRDVLIKDSPSWGVHLVDCDGVKLEGVRVDNRARPNGDGLDLESCRHVVISNCDISWDDDAICLKSSIPDPPCEHIVVTNCVISSNTAAIKFGTPSRAGFRDIAISNCAFYHCALGAIKLEAVDGGALEEIVIDNIAMYEVEGPLFLRLGNRAAKLRVPGVAPMNYEAADAPQPVSVLRNVLLSNIRATVKPIYVEDSMLRVDVDDQAKLGIMITGIPGHPVENVTLSNIHVTFPGGGTLEDAAIQVPEDETMYPEQFFFGKLPAYGAYLRHVRGVTFHNVRFELAARDLRPLWLCEDGEDIELSAFRAEVDPQAEAVVRLVNTQRVFIHGSRPLSAARRLSMSRRQRVGGADGWQ